MARLIAEGGSGEGGGKKEMRGGGKKGGNEHCMSHPPAHFMTHIPVCGMRETLRKGPIMPGT